MEIQNTRIIDGEARVWEANIYSTHSEDTYTASAGVLLLISFP
jgi:hypothetical protein